MISVLVAGKNGQLGQCLQSVALKNETINFIFKSSAELDITNKSHIDEVFSHIKPIDYCINCAAYTAVDTAEKDVEKAYNVNVLGSKNLAEVCKKHQVTLIHVSTDFVFDGNTNQPYKEFDFTNPLGVYGKTKLEGEIEIAAALQNHFIIRTSWLYSEYGNNFLKTMLRFSREKNEIGVVGDQIGSPTYAMDLAEAIVTVIKSNSSKYGIYHFSNSGVASWYDFAKAIFELSKSSIKLSKIETKDYPTPAKRPQFSVLDTTQMASVFGIVIPSWKDSLTKAVLNLKSLQ